jgi:hypothetical protein
LAQPEEGERILSIKKYSVAQIVGVLKQAAGGVPAKDLICKVGLTEQTY